MSATKEVNYMKRAKTPAKHGTVSAGRNVKAKFIPAMEDGEDGERYVAAMPRFEAKNANQKLALSFLNEGRQVVFLVGAAGNGKTMLAAYHAAKMLKSKRIEKVYLVRPAVVCGKSSGHLPGTLDEKLAPFFAQLLIHLGKFLGDGALTYMLEKKVIEYKAVEFLRGTSFEDCLVIMDEAQNFTEDEYTMLLTRVGENSQVILTGDQSQNDLRGASGLQSTLDLFSYALRETPAYLLDEDLDQLESNIGIVQFTIDDVVRSGLTRAFVKLFHYEGA